MTKGRPFLEVFASCLKEDYRFPILEAFAFLYVLGTFIAAGLGAIGAIRSARMESFAFNLATVSMELPLLVLVILILKNIAYGLGSDLERGVIQTLLSYPLKRRLILAAKLLSALVIALLLFLGIHAFALFLLAPDVIIAQFNVISLTYAAAISPILLLTGLALLSALLLKRGAIALVIGIIMYFALETAAGLVMFFTYATGSELALKVYGVISPSLLLHVRYAERLPFAPPREIWTPSLPEILLYIGAGYLVVALIFAIGFLYFERRLGV